ncbi:Cation transporter/ATPase, N-terminus [Methylocapsa palsarum]|uniref:Cation transporter/ATPase, N-terminus n=2 Tax=Methylocapsa palsarum TaxID=1612308 RepID=A0A1I4CW60_9HYPH|nr:Cation transporter/ATPase, N-terminus [Methylocapsa palsarum]
MTASDTLPRTAPSRPEAKADPNEALKSLPMPKLLTKLGSSTDGLTQAEARKRLAQYGPNEIEETKTNELLKFLGYFWGPIPWMIEVAVVLQPSIPKPTKSQPLHETPRPPPLRNPTISAGSAAARRALRPAAKWPGFAPP